MTLLQVVYLGWSIIPRRFTVVVIGKCFQYSTFFSITAYDETILSSFLQNRTYLQVRLANDENTPLTFPDVTATDSPISTKITKKWADVYRKNYHWNSTTILIQWRKATSRSNAVPVSSRASSPFISLSCVCCRERFLDEFNLLLRGRTSSSSTVLMKPSIIQRT